MGGRGRRESPGHILHDRIVAGEQGGGRRHDDQQHDDEEAGQPKRVQAEFQPALMDLLRRRLEPALRLICPQPTAKAEGVGVCVF